MHSRLEIHYYAYSRLLSCLLSSSPFFPLLILFHCQKAITEAQAAWLSQRLTAIAVKYH